MTDLLNNDSDEELSYVDGEETREHWDELDEWDEEEAKEESLQTIEPSTIENKQPKQEGGKSTKIKRSSIADRVDMLDMSRSDMTTTSASDEKAEQERSRHRKRLSLKRSSISKRVDMSSSDGERTTVKKRMLGVVAVLFFSLAFVNGMVYLVNKSIYDNNPDWNTKKNFDEFENPYEDIIKDTIPFVQDWYRALDLKENEPLLPSASSSGATTTDPSCISRWLDAIRNIAPDGEPVTSPQVIERVLKNLGLSDQPLIRAHLKDLLTEPQSLDTLFTSTNQCLSQSKALAQLACTTETLYPGHLNLTTTVQKSFLLDALHKAIVQERLTNALLSDLTSLHQVASTMQTSQLDLFESYVEQMYGDSPAKAEFRLAKYRGIAASLKAVANSLSANVPPPAVQYSLQINILEAVKLDIISGLEENARVGLALAAAVRFGPTVEEHRLSWRLGEEWVEAYTAWNMAFVTGATHITILSKLMIPAVSCTVGSEEGEDFFITRVVSLALTSMQINRPLLSGIDPDQPDEVVLMEQYYASQFAPSLEKIKLASALGSDNFNGLSLPLPSADEVEQMLFTLCAGRCRGSSWFGGNSNPVTDLSDDKFHVYLGFVLWMTILLAGLGLELLVLLSFLQSGWSHELEVGWRFAQFLFPLIIAATLGLALHRNYLSMLLVVVGLWKFGFPETLMYIYTALYKVEGISKLERFVEICNGVGTVVHHGAASFVISMLLSGTAAPTESLINPCLILLMQHWFVLLKYVSTLWYTIVELALEVWFEWIVISELEELFANHWTVALAANCMLVAHWLYLAAATGAQLSHGSLHVSEDEDLRVRYLESFQKKSKNFSSKMLSSFRKSRRGRNGLLDATKE